MQGHLRNLTDSCRVLIDAHAKGVDSLAHIGPFDWERFGSAVAQAEVLVRPETIDRTAELIERHRTVKLFAGQFLRAFAFRGAGPVRGILDALAIMPISTTPANDACPTRCHCASCRQAGGPS